MSYFDKDKPAATGPESSQVPTKAKAPDVPAPPVDNFLDNLWTFNYRKGQVLTQGIVRASSEGLAFLVASAWCERNGSRPAARVTPMILADERILKLGPLAAEDQPVPDAVSATTGV